MKSDYFVSYHKINNYILVSNHKLINFDFDNLSTLFSDNFGAICW